MYSGRTILLVLLVPLLALGHADAALATDPGAVTLTPSGNLKAEQFKPSDSPVFKDLGMLKGRDQFSVSWRTTTGTYGKDDFKQLVLATTAPKDGSAIQGLILSYDRSRSFALYQPRCVLNDDEKCDIRDMGIDLNVRARTLTFKNARFIRHSRATDFPDYIQVSGVLRY